MLVLDVCLRTCWIITGYICINSGNHAMGPTGRLLVDFAIVISQTGKCKYGHIPMHTGKCIRRFGGIYTFAGTS